MGKQFFKAWGGAFRDAMRFARALPWLIVLMFAFEFGQHVIEIRTGFFSADPAVRHAAGLMPIRLALGWPKMLVTWGLAFFAIRFLVLGDARASLRPSRTAFGRYALVALFQFVPTALVIYAEPILGLFGAGSTGAVLALRAVCGLGLQLSEPALLFWFVNAALGTAGYGPVASARTIGWLYFWTLLLVFVTRLPFNLLHQLLNRWPVGHSAFVLWLALLVDAMVVPAMVVIIAAVEVRAVRIIAERRGRSVLAGPAPS